MSRKASEKPTKQRHVLKRLHFSITILICFTVQNNGFCHQTFSKPLHKTVSKLPMLSDVVCCLDELERLAIRILKQSIFAVHSKWGKRVDLQNFICKSMETWDLAWRTSDSSVGPLNSLLYMKQSEVLQKHCKALIWTQRQVWMHTIGIIIFYTYKVTCLWTSYHDIKKCANPNEALPVEDLSHHCC